ncbi:MAG: PVC-type heme-binding CxxCH protein [Rubripirellula sp.]
MTSLAILVLVASVSLSLSRRAFAATPERPNVILIMTDNHGAWTLGCYGNEDIRTPNIDRLAAEGVLFTRAFASNPVCSPTRATCLTGLVPSQHGVHSFLSGGRLQVGPNARCTLDEFTSLPEVLRSNGYACGLVGKWHLGDNLRPQEGLDDYWITMPHGGTSTFYDAQIIQDGKLRKEPKYLTDFWTEHAVKFIDQQASQDEPFFLFLAYNGPYALSRLLLREGQNRHADYYADKPLRSFPRGKVHPWQLNNRDFINNPTSIQRVATEVSGVDDGVGEVMQALRNHQLDENTLIVFVADQGWVGGHGGFFGMGDHTRPLTARDGMMRIPLIWRQPKSIANHRREDQLIANYDLMPTLLGQIGLGDQMPTSPKSPGSDYSHLLKTNSDRAVETPASKTASDAVFYEFENLRCVRTESHKYVHRHPNGPHELYDLTVDPDEFMNLADDPTQSALRSELKTRLDQFYETYSLPKYDMWNGGTSQVRIHDGIDEELAQHVPIEPPPLTAGFAPAPIDVPEGFTADLVAGPPLVTHPTMACLDDQGRLYVCNNSGVNMSNDELEENLPNSIRQLVDQDGDGRYDTANVFADKMTFPMGGVWHDGSLYVASPPNIWKLTDTNEDGVADERVPIVSEFGYNGNAASIHGCFFGPDGRLYWTDGYHGHEFKDEVGNISSKREGSYIFSCLPDGSDKRIHCGGGMDNPVELDFTRSGDVLGTVNILYTRPRVDCFVHWQHGGVYPHRERVLKEVKVTGDLLGPAHRFGHVAVSGMTRYRSGVLDHRWGDDHFVTFFNSGKVTRLELEPNGSTYDVTQHEFLSSPSREFHPTDVLEDTDGSLLVIDTGGWFYRGCPTSQFAKPDLLGGIYRIRRTGMTTLPDSRGAEIDWQGETPASLVKRFNDTRHHVRELAIQQCVKRGEQAIPTLQTMVARGDVRVRENAVLALTRLLQHPDHQDAATRALLPALSDALPHVRQSACRGLGFATTTPPDLASQIRELQDDADAGVRRQAHVTLGMLSDSNAVPNLLAALGRKSIDRPEAHAAIYALIEINDADQIRNAAMAQSSLTRTQRDGLLLALAQIDGSQLTEQETMEALFDSDEQSLQRLAIANLHKHPGWTDALVKVLREKLNAPNIAPGLANVLGSVMDQDSVANLAGQVLHDENSSARLIVLDALAIGKRAQPVSSWESALKALMQSSDEELARAALRAATPYNHSDLRRSLVDLASDEQRPIALRMDAMSALHSGTVDTNVLKSLIELYSESISPTAADRAAQIIGGANLKHDQLDLLVPLLPKASSSQIRELIRPFQRNVKEQQAEAFLSALEIADSFESLAEHEVSDVVKRFPRPSMDQANKLLDRLKQHHQQKLNRLHRLRDRLDRGDPERGKQIFASKKAKCSDCHRIGKDGKAVGPDLTTIGANRSASDLLESIVFPSASIVRDYATYQVLTVNGRALTGMVVDESADHLVLQQASGDRVRLQSDDIEIMSPSSVSIMPAGLEGVLNEQELIDVVTYLRSKT